MTLVLGILIGASIAVMMIAFICCLIESHHFRKRPKTKRLCPTCRTGMKLYRLDNRDGMCPYVNCYTGEYCAYYQPISKEEKGFIKQMENQQ